GVGLTRRRQSRLQQHALSLPSAHRRFSRQAPGSGESLTIWDFRDLWIDSPQFAGLSTLPFRSPSFPHAYARIQVGSELDPRQKHSGVTPSKEILTPSSSTSHLAARLFICYRSTSKMKPIGFSLRTQSLPY